MLLLCTNRHGGSPCQSTSRSFKYVSLASSLSEVASNGDGSVVKITAVLSLWLAISSFSMRCCARLGRSLNESGIDARSGYPDADCLFPEIDRDGRRAYADSNWFDRGGDELTANMMDGPAPSSTLTLASGIGAELNRLLDGERLKGGRTGRVGLWGESSPPVVVMVGMFGWELSSGTPVLFKDGSWLDASLSLSPSDRFCF